MPFNHLLWHSLLPGLTIAEKGVGIRIEKQPEERILFFSTDSQVGREAFSIPHDKPVCDAMVFYRKSGDGPVLVFAEFKGGDVRHALRQIECTIEAVRALIPRHLPVRKYVALVVSSSGAPQGQAKLSKPLIDKGIIVYLKTGVKGKNIDIRPYLN